MAKKAIIIDDEQDARENLWEMVQEYCPEIEVIAQAGNITDGYSAITQHRPDLVFLDIEMPGGSGFDLLERFPEIDFSVIFTTAYGHYSIRAIRFSALDYLLKPIDPDELVAATQRFSSQTKEKSFQPELMATLLRSLKNDSPPKKIAIPDSKGISLIELEKILRFEANGSRTIVHLGNGKAELSTKPLKEYDKLLSEFQFIRVHHAHLVNLDAVNRYVRGEGGFLIMSDEAEVEVSRRRKAELIKRLGA